MADFTKPSCQLQVIVAKFIKPTRMNHNFTKMEPSVENTLQTTSPNRKRGDNNEDEEEVCWDSVAYWICFAGSVVVLVSVIWMFATTRHMEMMKITVYSLRRGKIYCQRIFLPMICIYRTILNGQVWDKLDDYVQVKISYFVILVHTFLSYLSRVTVIFH